MNFKLIEILSNSIINKKINILGLLDDKLVLITLEKNNYFNENISSYIESINLEKPILENDIYKKFNYNLLEKNTLSIVYDPNQDLINKLRNKKNILKKETYNDYLKKELNFYNNTQWIRNIFEGKSETEKIIYQDSNFILLPDYKWDNCSIDNLYYLGIAKKFNNDYIKCLRDINIDHLEVLEKMLSITNLIEQKNNLEKNSIIAYIHYPPSFYIFHVHYVYLENDIFKTGFPRNVLLSDIIQNIKIKSNYYQIKEIDIIDS